MTIDGIYTIPMNTERLELMKELRAQKKSYTEIGKVFNITRQRAHQLLSETHKENMRLKRKSPRLSTGAIDS